MREPIYVGVQPFEPRSLDRESLRQFYFGQKITDELLCCIQCDIAQLERHKEEIGDTTEGIEDSLDLLRYLKHHVKQRLGQGY